MLPSLLPRGNAFLRYWCWPDSAKNFLPSRPRYEALSVEYCRGLPRCLHARWHVTCALQALEDPVRVVGQALPDDMEHVRPRCPVSRCTSTTGVAQPEPGVLVGSCTFVTGAASGLRTIFFFCV